MKAFGKYQLLDEIGKGTAGTTYRACERLSAREVVIKILDQNALEAKADFCRELTACAELQHPNIVRILDIGEVDGAIYVAAEFLQGVDLRRHLLECRKLPLARKLRLMAQVYDGLALAHGHQITHGAIRPANIFLTSHGDAKILDFGLGKGGDVASDLFSTAVVLYQFVADVAPFQTASNAEPRLLRKLDKHIPEDLERLVASALAKDPQQRPPTAQIMAASLCAIAESLKLVEQPHPVSSVSALAVAIETPPAPLAASATAGATSGGPITSPASKPDATASAAPQPARDNSAEVAAERTTKSLRPTSEVTRLTPAAPSASVQKAPAQTSATPSPAVARPSPVQQRGVRRGIALVAAAVLGIFIVAGLLSRQTSNATQSQKPAQSGPEATPPPIENVPSSQPPALPGQPAAAAAPQTEHPADQILIRQVATLWESGEYAQAQKLVDAILAAEPGNTEALSWKKKIRAAQDAEAALR